MAILVQSTPVAVVRYPVAVVALQGNRSNPEAVVPVAPVAVLVPVAPVAVVVRSTPVAVVRSTPVAAVVGSSGRTTPVADVCSTPVAVVPEARSVAVVPVAPVAVSVW